ncbi:hypothetical protein C8F04DRAFT_1268793 [Mycena alexandri]|uniref:Uncharacterized protein n=1 Tax=Mycena alexandri TaxID=1745969 RepID=A0AAD6WWD1_9AGAR|nr:hypothetical protein C8F04DRAFT_1268793 [Mycena alexandri]
MAVALGTESAVTTAAATDKKKALNLTLDTPAGNLVVRMKPQTKFRTAREVMRPHSPHFPDDSDACSDGYREGHRYGSHTLTVTHAATGRRVTDDDTPESMEVEDGDDFLMYREQYGGKPVIHLYSPVEKEATVSLTLTRDRSFVRTHLDGTLTELNTGLDVAYLFWEAHTNHGIPMSPPASLTIAPSDQVERFSRLTCDLSPVDSTLIAVGDLTTYLDKIPLALGLHIEARTSFITSHKHTALRFAPQTTYETAAVLDITPTPDVVTRVFMLFKGVPADALGRWQDAKQKSDDSQRWHSVVGVDVERAADAELFRALEWGGMEVLGGERKEVSLGDAQVSPPFRRLVLPFNAC